MYKVLANDNCYVHGSNLSFKRLILNNSLDKRFRIEVVEEEVKAKVEKIRDPFQFIQFFKSKVLHEVNDEYLEFLDEV